MVVRRSADGTHFLDKPYELYRGRCLELWEISYQVIEYAGFHHCKTGYTGSLSVRVEAFD